MEMTKKASARTKKDHKITFKVTSVAGSEDQSVRVISNPSATDAMRIDYFQLARKWKVDLLRYGLRMTYDIVIPNPGLGHRHARRGREGARRADQHAVHVHAAAVGDHLQLAGHRPAPDQQLRPAGRPVRRGGDGAARGAEVGERPQGDGPVSDDDYGNVHFDSLEFDIDDDYYIYSVQVEYTATTQQGRAALGVLDDRRRVDRRRRREADRQVRAPVARLHVPVHLQRRAQHHVRLPAEGAGAARLAARRCGTRSGRPPRSSTTRACRSIRTDAAELVQQIADYDALTLRRMEQEEIMKGVLRWLLGPQFYLVPFDLASLFGPDTNDPDAHDVLDPNRLTDAEWLAVMEHGEFIKYVHNAIEWENVLYFTYPYFWDDNALWHFKKFLYHPDPDAPHVPAVRRCTGRADDPARLRAELHEPGRVGRVRRAARPTPVRDDRPGDPGLREHELPGLPAREPRAGRTAAAVPRAAAGLARDAVRHPAAQRAQGGDRRVPVRRRRRQHGAGGGARPVPRRPDRHQRHNYNGVNDYNTQANNQQLALDPTTPQEALLPTYTAVPVDDLVWGNPYFYQCPGDTGDYDLISYGADGQPGGTDKDADISANCEASLIVDLVRVHADQRARHRDHDEPAERRPAAAEPGDRVILTDRSAEADRCRRWRPRRRRADVDVQPAAEIV